MSWEWVAPTVTGLVGVAGVTATYFTGKGGRDHAERVAERAARHAADAAWEARRQQRLQETYVSLLEMVGDFLLFQA